MLPLGPLVTTAPPTVTPLPPSAIDLAPGRQTTAPDQVNNCSDLYRCDQAGAAQLDDRAPGDMGQAWQLSQAAAARDGRDLRCSRTPADGSELRKLLASLRVSSSSGARVARAYLMRYGLQLRPTRSDGKVGTNPDPLPNSKADRTRAVLRWSLRIIGRPVGLRVLYRSVRQLLERQARRELKSGRSCSGGPRRSSCRDARAAQLQTGPLKR